MDFGSRILAKLSFGHTPHGYKNRLIKSNSNPIDAANDTHRKDGYRHGPFPTNRITTTKYTPLTFLPLNIIEQYKRFSNWYFTLLVILNFVPAVAAVNPILSLAPLCIVLATTAIKDIIEDVNRWRSDKRLNATQCNIYNHKKKTFASKCWSDIKVGDILQLQFNEPIPADVVLIASSEEDGVCYLETSDLDGETNLKQKQSLTTDKIACEDDVIQVADAYNYYLKCQEPSVKLHNFEGSIHKSGEVALSLDLMDSDQMEAGLKYENFMMRGCILRNTDYALAVVVYTGAETKTMMNNTGPRRKRSKLETAINSAVLWSFVILMVICAVVAVLNNIQTRTWMQQNTRQLFYPISGSDSAWQTGAVTFARLIIVLQVIIPISLYITIEIVKSFQVWFISRDIKLYDEESNKQTQCRAMNITEDLGQVQYIFSDKTGTLTENKMEFRKCSIAGVDYRHLNKSRYRKHTKANSSVQFHHRRTQSRPISIHNIGQVRPQNSGTMKMDDVTSIERPVLSLDKQLSAAIASENESVYEWFRCLALCNTVMPSNTMAAGAPPKDTLYEGESPDEVALVYACQKYAFHLSERKKKSVTIQIGSDKSETYEVLHVLPFSSDRKRMSIIVRPPGLSELILYSKGADDILLSLCENGTSAETIKNTRQHLDSYAREGLRTLCMARRIIPEVVYSEWLDTFRQAESTLENRDTKLGQCYDEIEQRLVLLGASGIEDHLQQDVPQSIEAFRAAGIKVWVITGDKIETAVNIAYSSHLFGSKNESENPEFYLTNCRSDEDVQYVLNQLETEMATRDINLVLDGQTMGLIFDDDIVSKQFIALTKNCPAVLCCRVTPRQKGHMVQLVKKELNVLTLAIGDGANDVSMLQISDIGIGISGLEGMQAVLNSDFSIPKFKYLRTLLFIHGHWCYYRLAIMILYFFYRNVVFVFVLFYYQFFSGYYGSNPIEETVLVTFSLLFNSLPPIIQGVLDQDLTRSTLSSKSALYRQGMMSEVYRVPQSFWIFISLGLWQSLCCFMLSYFATLDTTLTGKVDVDYLGFGYYIATSTLLVNLVSQAIEYKTFTWIHWASLAISWFGYILFVLVTTVIGLSVPSCLDMFGPYFGMGNFWLCMATCTAAGCLPHLMCRVLQTEYWPTECQLERTREREREQVTDSSLLDTFNSFMNESFRFG